VDRGPCCPVHAEHRPANERAAAAGPRRDAAEPGRRPRKRCDDASGRVCWWRHALCDAARERRAEQLGGARAAGDVRCGGRRKRDDAAPWAELRATQWRATDVRAVPRRRVPPGSLRDRVAAGHPTFAALAASSALLAAFATTTAAALAAATLATAALAAALAATTLATASFAAAAARAAAAELPPCPACRVAAVPAAATLHASALAAAALASASRVAAAAAVAAAAVALAAAAVDDDRSASVDQRDGGGRGH